MWQYGISVEISVRMIKPKCPQWKVWKRGNNNENCGDEDCRGTGSRTASQTEPRATRHHDHLPLTVGLDHIHVLWLEDVWLTGTTALLSFVNICETHGGLSKNLSLYEPLHFLNYKYTRHAILTHILTLYIFFLHPHAYKLCNTEVIYFASRVFLTLHYTDCKMVQFTWRGHIGSKSQIWDKNIIARTIFSCKSNSTIANICLSIHPSVRQQNPSIAWNCHPSSFFIHPSFILRLLNFSACLRIMFHKINAINEMFQLWPLLLGTTFGSNWHARSM